MTESRPPRQQSCDNRTGIDKIDQALALIDQVVSDLEGDVLSADLARRLVDRLNQVERIAAAGVAIAAKRVAESNSWCSEGDRSPAHWVARQTGVAVGAAQATLDTARKLEQLPAVDAAVRSGQLSPAQVQPVADAATADPSQAERLIAKAAQTGLHGLRSECAKVRAAAATDPDARRQAIHRRRSFSHWVDDDGSFAFSGRATVEHGARLLAAMRPHHDRIFREAREQGRRDPQCAYALDSLIALADETSLNARCGDTQPTVAGRPRAKQCAPARVHVRIDHSALVRGRVEAGETCEIAGIGPVPVTTAKSMMSDAFLAAIVTHGTDIRTVAHMGRTIPALLRTALVERDPTCVVPGCTASDYLEIDHVIPFADGGPTRLDNLARLCRHHHDQKTYEGWQLTGPPGHRKWMPPVAPPVDKSPVHRSTRRPSNKNPADQSTRKRRASTRGRSALAPT